MFRFTIRDVLWLMVVVGLAVSWWLDNKRIEHSVTRLEKERRLMQADYDDKLAVLNELQLEQQALWVRLRGSGIPMPNSGKGGGLVPPKVN